MVSKNCKEKRRQRREAASSLAAPSRSETKIIDLQPGLAPDFVSARKRRWRNNMEQQIQLERIRNEHQIEMSRIKMGQNMIQEQQDRTQAEREMYQALTPLFSSTPSYARSSHLPAPSHAKKRGLQAARNGAFAQSVQRQQASVLSYQSGETKATIEQFQTSHQGTTNALELSQDYDEDVFQYIQSIAGRKLKLYGRIVTSCTFSTIENQWFTAETFNLLCTVTLIPRDWVLHVSDARLELTVPAEFIRHVAFVCFTQYGPGGPGHWFLIHASLRRGLLECCDSLLSPEQPLKDVHHDAHCRVIKMLEDARLLDVSKQWCPELMKPQEYVRQSDGSSCGPLVWREIEARMGLIPSRNETPTAIRRRLTKTLVAIAKEDATELIHTTPDEVSYVYSQTSSDKSTSEQRTTSATSTRHTTAATSTTSASFTPRKRRLSSGGPIPDTAHTRVDQGSHKLSFGIVGSKVVTESRKQPKSPYMNVNVSQTLASHSGQVSDKIGWNCVRLTESQLMPDSYMDTEDITTFPLISSAHNPATGLASLETQSPSTQPHADLSPFKESGNSVDWFNSQLFLTQAHDGILPDYASQSIGRDIDTSAPNAMNEASNSLTIDPRLRDLKPETLSPQHGLDQRPSNSEASSTLSLIRVATPESKVPSLTKQPARRTAVPDSTDDESNVNLHDGAAVSTRSKIMHSNDIDTTDSEASYNNNVGSSSGCDTFDGSDDDAFSEIDHLPAPESRENSTLARPPKHWTLEEMDRFEKALATWDPPFRGEPDEIRTLRDKFFPSKPLQFVRVRWFYHSIGWTEHPKNPVWDHEEVQMLIDCMYSGSRVDVRALELIPSRTATAIIGKAKSLSKQIVKKDATYQFWDTTEDERLLRISTTGDDQYWDDLAYRAFKGRTGRNLQTRKEILQVKDRTELNDKTERRYNRRKKPEADKGDNDEGDVVLSAEPIMIDKKPKSLVYEVKYHRPNSDPNSASGHLIISTRYSSFAKRPRDEMVKRACSVARSFLIYHRQIHPTSVRIWITMGRPTTAAIDRRPFRGPLIHLLKSCPGGERLMIAGSSADCFTGNIRSLYRLLEFSGFVDRLTFSFLTNAQWKSYHCLGMMAMIGAIETRTPYTKSDENEDIINLLRTLSDFCELKIDKGLMGGSTNRSQLWHETAFRNRIVRPIPNSAIVIGGLKNVSCPFIHCQQRKALRFDDAAILVKHIMDEHHLSITKRKKGSYACPYDCVAVLRSLDEVKTHLLDQCPRSWKCDRCGYSVGSRPEFTLHNAKHDDIEEIRGFRGLLLAAQQERASTE